MKVREPGTLFPGTFWSWQAHLEQNCHSSTQFEVTWLLVLDPPPPNYAIVKPNLWHVFMILLSVTYNPSFYHLIWFVKELIQYYHYKRKSIWVQLNKWSAGNCPQEYVIVEYFTLCFTFDSDPDFVPDVNVFLKN